MKTPIEKNVDFWALPNKGGGVYPCPNFLALPLVIIHHNYDHDIRDGKFMFVRNELRQLHEGSQQTGDTIDWNGQSHDADDDDVDDVENGEFLRQRYNP